MKIRSPHWTLLKYLSKWQDNRHREEWLSNPYVQQVLTNGEIDKEKLKALFEERGLMSPSVFETTLASLPDGLIDKTSLQVKQQGKQEYRRINDMYEGEVNAREEAEKIKTGKVSPVIDVEDLLEKER